MGKVPIPQRFLPQLMSLAPRDLSEDKGYKTPLGWCPEDPNHLQEEATNKGGNQRLYSQIQAISNILEGVLSCEGDRREREKKREQRRRKKRVYGSGSVLLKKSKVVGEARPRIGNLVLSGQLGDHPWRWRDPRKDLSRPEHPEPALQSLSRWSGTIVKWRSTVAAPRLGRGSPSCQIRRQVRSNQQIAF